MSLLSDYNILQYIEEGSIKITGNVCIQYCAVDLEIEGTHTLNTGDKLVVRTKNIIKLPDFLVANVVGRTRYARKGLNVTPQLIHPGFEGHITLKLENTSSNAIKIYDGTLIASISFKNINSL